MRYYLSNSHVADLRAPQAEFLRFTIKMLASLAARNFSVGRIDLCAEAQRLSDYRSLDVIFGGLRMNELHLSCDEHRFVELVKTTDFFRMSKVQGLRQLRLELVCFPTCNYGYLCLLRVFRGKKKTNREATPEVGARSGYRESACCLTANTIESPTAQTVNCE